MPLDGLVLRALHYALLRDVLDDAALLRHVLHVASLLRHVLYLPLLDYLRNVFCLVLHRVVVCHTFLLWDVLCALHRLVFKNGLLVGHVLNTALSSNRCLLLYSHDGLSHNLLLNLGLNDLEGLLHHRWLYYLWLYHFRDPLLIVLHRLHVTGRQRGLHHLLRHHGLSHYLWWQTGTNIARC